MEIREWVGNKNYFIDICNKLGLGLLQTFCFKPKERFINIEQQLNPNSAYIIKPAIDRTRFEDQRRRFYRLSDIQALRQFMASAIGQAMTNEAYQIQEYIDFNHSQVAYFNMTFEVANKVQPRLVTQQILNLSAIHNNQEALHWGNASVSNQHSLEEGLSGCHILVNHYYQAGYRGEIGIDFGIQDGRCFFLEANARENNGTRLHKQLQQLAMHYERHSFLFLRNIPFDLMREEKIRRGDPEIKEVIDCGDRKLIIGASSQEISPLIALVEEMTRQQPPFPY